MDSVRHTPEHLSDRNKKDLLYGTSGKLLEERLEQIAQVLEGMDPHAEIVTVVGDIRRAARLVKKYAIESERRAPSRHEHF